ncbi:MAG: hypothetical protein V3V20_07910, partial [Algisphaera sp.]
MRLRHFYLMTGLATLTLGTTLPASALIVQGSGSGIAMPSVVSNALGRWGGNAGAVAVASEWVLTTRHQDSLASPPNRTVVLDGSSYTALASDPASVVNLNADLRLVRIQNTDGSTANLTATLDVYDGPTLTTGTALTLGGFGPGLGAASGADGFAHAGANNNTNPQRFGTNTLDAQGALDDPGTIYDTMGVLVADFDDIGASESTVGPGDSGGVWLMNDGGTFKITGLTFAVDTPTGGAPAAF